MSSIGANLPASWCETTIEEIFDTLEDGRTLHQGWSPQCEAFASTSEDVWGALKTTAIQPGRFCSEYNKQLPPRLEPRPLLEAKAGDILLTCAGPRSRCGIACLVRNTRKRLMISGKMYRFRVPDGIDPRFIEAYLQTSVAQAAIDRMKTGGSDSGLNLTHERFRKLAIRLAPRNEQQRIMDTIEELLSDLDAGVEALKSAEAKLERFRASVLKAAVDGTLTADWRNAHAEAEPASVLLQRILTERRDRWEQEQVRRFEERGRNFPTSWKSKYKEPLAPDIGELPSIPEGWCWASLGQLSEIQGGLQKTPDRRPVSHFVPYLRVANVHRNELDLTNLYNFEVTEAELIRLQLEKGDLLIVEGNGSRTEIGRCAVWAGEVPACIHQNHIIRSRPVGQISSAYLNMYLNSPTGRELIERIASSTSGLYTLSVSKIEKIPIALPPLDEQVQITESVDTQSSILEHLVRDIQSKLRQSESLRHSVLNRAFAGMLVPQHAADEPASELLRRIAAERAIKAQKPRTKRTRRPAKRRRQMQLA